MLSGLILLLGASFLMLLGVLGIGAAYPDNLSSRQTFGHALGIGAALEGYRKVG